MFVHEHCNYMTPTSFTPNPPHAISQIPDLLILSLCVYLSGADRQEIDNLCECSSWKGRDSATLSSHWPSAALSRKGTCEIFPVHVGLSTGVIMLVLFRFTSVNMFYVKLNVQTLYFQNILHWILTNKHNARCAICRTGTRTKFVKHPWYWIKHLVLRERLIFLLNCVQYYK